MFIIKLQRVSLKASLFHDFFRIDLSNKLSQNFSCKSCSMCEVSWVYGKTQNQCGNSAPYPIPIYLHFCTISFTNFHSLRIYVLIRVEDEDSFLKEGVAYVWWVHGIEVFLGVHIFRHFGLVFGHLLEHIFEELWWSGQAVFSIMYVPLSTFLHNSLYGWWYKIQQ